MAVFYADAASLSRPAPNLPVGPTDIPFEFPIAVGTTFGTSGDIIRLVNLPRYGMVVGAVIDIPDIDSGATATRFDLGDSGSATRFITGINPTAAIRVSSYDISLSAGAGFGIAALPRRYDSAADYVRLTLTTANVTTLITGVSIVGHVRVVMYPPSV